MANSSQGKSKHEVGVKAKKEKQMGKQSEKGKEKGVNEDGNEIGADTYNPTMDMQIDSEKKKSAQESEENLDLVMKTDDWAASLASLALSLYEEDEGQNSANR